jgi:hypothetical protein
MSKSEVAYLKGLRTRARNKAKLARAKLEELRGVASATLIAWYQEDVADAEETIAYATEELKAMGAE